MKKCKDKRNSNSVNEKKVGETVRERETEKEEWESRKKETERTTRKVMAKWRIIKMRIKDVQLLKQLGNGNEGKEERIEGR